MRFIPLFVIFIWSVSLSLVDAQVKSPKEFLGYEIGEKFTFHYQVEAYFKHMSEQSPYVSMEYYGESYEGRPMYVVYISSPQHISNLNAIKESNLSLAKIKDGKKMSDQPVIVWMSYNIHGNEAVSTEAAMLTSFELLKETEAGKINWLDNTVVVVDPCLNPDGHTRYVQFYTERVGRKADITAFTREHLEPWPGGRPNHYLFDLNRDWAWQTQKETQERIALLNSWLPQVHVDYHEMGINSPYFFAPAAEPIHDNITAWQRIFLEKVGRHLGKEFDKRNWLYFAGEVFDLFYPSYGDTYPSFNGSIGMTYEQGGSGRAGLAVMTAEGDTLTLRNRIDHHHIAGLYTIELASIEAKKLLSEFEQYFTNSISNPAAKYKTYVIKNTNQDKINHLEAFLDRNGIRYGYGTSGATNQSGYSYQHQKQRSVTISDDDMVINAYQPKSVLLNVLFEPKTHLPDSATYDITGWALPYAFGLDAYAIESNLKFKDAKKPNPLPVNNPNLPIAYALKWQSLEDAKFISSLIQSGIKPRFTTKAMKFKNLTLTPGSIIITRNQHEHLGDSFDAIIQRTARQLDRALIYLESSYPEEGPSFGSSSVTRIDGPRIGLLSGKGTSPYNVGEIWHLFDQEIQYPIHLFEVDMLQEKNLAELDVLILPELYGGSGMLKESVLNNIKSWVNSGGVLISFESAVSQLVGKDGFEIAYKSSGDKKKGETTEDEFIDILPYEEQMQRYISQSNPGAIFKVLLDKSHPLAFGYGDHFYLLKTNNRLYAPLKSGHDVGICQSAPVVSGFVGANLLGQMEHFLSIGVQPMGRGQVVYFADNPIFRSFWQDGKLLMANAVFFLK